MNKLDIYYRTLKDLKRLAAQNRETSNELSTFIKNNPEGDILKSTKYLCSINDDWIIAIEEGLIYVEKAVAEQRQFITTNSEIVEIEKVKRVSRASIEHLAKHANMITHLPKKEGDDLIPDKILMVEKLSDFAVYENRFLYMMLKYLESFIRYRLEKIEKLRSSYKGLLVLDKKVKTEKRTLSYKLELNDFSDSNPYPLKDEKTDQLITRIKNCALIVTSLLQTDLMIQVSKTPLLKPPVTKTNVLKMNNNFKRSLALYDYIASYTKEGFEFKEVTADFMPFNSQIANEIALTMGFTSFINYKIANDLDDLLELEYLNEEARRKEEEKEKLKKQIERIKRKALESNMTLEEYCVMLTNYNDMLQSDSDLLKLKEKEIEELTLKLDEANKELLTLTRIKEELEEKLNQKIKEIQELHLDYQAKISDLKTKHKEEINYLKAKHEEEIIFMQEEYETNLQEVLTSNKYDIDALTNDYEQKLLEQKNYYLNIIEEKVNEAVNLYQTKLEKLTKDYNLEIEALKSSHVEEVYNLTTDYTNKLEEKSDELENAKLDFESQKEELNFKISELKLEVDYNDAVKNEISQAFEQKLEQLNSEYSKEFNEFKDYATSMINFLEDDNKFLKDSFIVIDSKLKASNYKNGLLTPSLEYTSKEAFEELEEQFNYFKKYFKKQWDLTKKQIRNKILWNKETISNPLKEILEKDDSKKIEEYHNLAKEKEEALENIKEDSFNIPNLEEIKNKTYQKEEINIENTDINKDNKNEE